MLLSRTRHYLNSRLGTKFILTSVLLIGFISIVLSTFFVIRQKKLLMDELNKRAFSLANNLAYNSQFPMMVQDEETILNFISGVKQEEDINDVFIVGNDGRILFHSDSTMVRQRIQTLPDYFNFDSVLRGDWVPSGDGNTMKILSLIADIPSIDSESSDFLLSSPDMEVNRDLFYGNTFFPCFTADSKEVTFTSNRGLGFNIWKINIETRDISQLVKFAANGWWSHNGRYFVFCRYERDPFVVKTSVFDAETKEIRAIQKVPTYPQPKFSHDDKYILTQEYPEDGEIRISRVPFEGGEPEQLTSHDGLHVWPESSPDGKWIIYTEYKSKTMYVYNTETQISSRVFPDLEVPHGAGTFSPDGDKICYFKSSAESLYDENELFVADFPYVEGSRNYGTQITFTGKRKTIIPEWSPDGRWIVYPEDSSTLVIVSPDGGEPINILRGTRVLGFATLDVSLENVNREIAAAIWQAVGITLIMIFIGAFGVIYLVRNIAGPIHTLAESAQAVGREDFDQIVEINRTDEIGVLANSFNDMTARLKTSRNKLETLNLGLESKVMERTSELESSHKKLEAAYLELETLDKAKDDFLSLVSHELRTPLSSVLLYSEMLLDGLAENKETRSEFLTTIVDNCKRLTRLINDVLDLSKIEAGRMPFTIEDINIKDLVNETYSGVRPSLESHGIAFECDKIDETVCLSGDRDKIVQVLTNVVSNAVKFTPEKGTITVFVNVDDSMGKITVSDTGKGIAKENISKVFDRFSQLESIDHHAGGTGLGMTISKSIIERLGGEIWIESELDQGTTVFFTLPLSKKQENKPELKEKADETG